MLGHRRGAGDGGGRSAVTVCGNEATRLESARGGGGIRAPARSLVVLNGNKQPRLRNSDSLTRSTSTMSRSVTRSELSPAGIIMTVARLDTAGAIQRRVGGEPALDSESHASGFSQNGRLQKPCLGRHLIRW